MRCTVVEEVGFKWRGREGNRRLEEETRTYSLFGADLYVVLQTPDIRMTINPCKTKRQAREWVVDRIAKVADGVVVYVGEELGVRDDRVVTRRRLGRR